MAGTTGTVDFGNIFNELCSGKYDFKGKETNPQPVADYSEYVHYKKDYEDLKEEFTQYRKRVQNTLETEKKLLKRELIRNFLSEFVVFMVNVYKGKKEHGETWRLADEDYLILKKMNDFLDSMNVVPMEDPVGKQFDPNTMDAIYTDHYRMGDCKDGDVTKVLYNGFTMDGEVLLHQKVAVYKS